jgi:hypothetical protein
VLCSAALPTIARTKTPTKMSDMPSCSAVCSIAPTRNSLSIATRPVQTRRINPDIQTGTLSHAERLVGLMIRLSHIQVLMCVQGENEAQNVGNDQDQRDFHAERALQRHGIGAGKPMKQGRYDKGDRAQRRAASWTATQPSD